MASQAFGAYLPSLRTLPYTRSNPSVRIFRHATAIDERRRMFRLNHWASPQDFVENPFSQSPVKKQQDIRQLWFAGVHADIGGGYPESESGLSKFPLIWMIEEAVAKGLMIDRDMFDHLGKGMPAAASAHRYVAPDCSAMLHQSLRGAWWLLEWLPKQVKWKEWPGRQSLLGWYLPRAEPRLINEGDAIAPSVDERKAAVPDYRPINLP